MWLMMDKNSVKLFLQKYGQYANFLQTLMSIMDEHYMVYQIDITDKWFIFNIEIEDIQTVHEMLEITDLYRNSFGRFVLVVNNDKIIYKFRM